MIENIEWLGFGSLLDNWYKFLQLIIVTCRFEFSVCMCMYTPSSGKRNGYTHKKC